MNIDNGAGRFLLAHMVRKLAAVLLKGLIFVRNDFMRADGCVAMKYERERLALGFDLVADAGNFA